VIRPALTLTALTIVLLGFVYPGVVTGLAQLMPHQANGSLVIVEGKVIGSELIGQEWNSDKYFHGRPSAAKYDAANSTGSNLGPTSKALAERLHSQEALPLDLRTTSGSGLDPHISPEAARYQIPRVAKARNLSEDKIAAIVERHIEGRTFGILGEPRVNVLALNLDLDR
jgi:K+-transporting ATPase ATPase C chain